jgi:L-fuculose-phosphate aldolase
MGFDEVTVDDLFLVSLASEVVPVAGRPDSELAIATKIMATRRDLNAVVHAHSLYATAFGTTDRSLHAISHEGCHLVPPEIARVSDPGFVSSDRDGYVAALGLRNAVLMRGHGLVAVGESLGEAVAFAVYLEKACQLQLLAGDDVHAVTSDEVVAKRSGQLKRPRISWEYLERVTPPGWASV